MGKIRLRRWLILFLVMGGTMCAGCTVILLNALSNANWGMYGGDCTDAGSDSQVIVTGTVKDSKGNPVPGIEIHAHKELGGCPQSQAIDKVFTSDGRGFFDSGRLPYYFADPDIVFTISASGFPPCLVRYESAWGGEIQLIITLSDYVQVEGVAREVPHGWINGGTPFIGETEISQCASA